MEKLWGAFVLLVSVFIGFWGLMSLLTGCLAFTKPNLPSEEAGQAGVYFVLGFFGIYIASRGWKRGRRLISPGTGENMVHLPASDQKPEEGTQATVAREK